MLLRDVGAFVIDANGPGTSRGCDREFKPRGRAVWIWMGESRFNLMMMDNSIGGICPELNERMRVGALGSSPVIGGKEQKSQ